MLKREKILKFRIISSMFLASFSLVLGGALWAYFSLKSVSGPIIIHFNNLTGINLIGNYLDLVMAGVAGLVVIFVNFVITIELEERDRFLGKLLAASTVVFSILIFIALAAIISVN